MNDRRSSYLFFFMRFLAATVALCCLSISVQGGNLNLEAVGGHSLAGSEAWVPGAGCPPPHQQGSQASPVLSFTAPFAKAGFPGRAVWDIPVTSDLRGASGLSLRIRCRNTSPVRQFTLYLKSGDSGWYAAHFMPKGDGRWQRINIHKETMDLEGDPAGWGRITHLRFAAWKAAPETTQFDLSEIRAVPSNSPILLVRGGSTEARRYAENVVRSLRRHGIRPRLVEESDLAPELFDSVRLVILPYNPSLAGRAAGVLRAQLAKPQVAVLGFYSVPDALQPLLGLRHQSYVRAEQIPGKIAGFRISGNSAPPSMPAWVPQKSWMIEKLAPPEASITPIARWVTGNGKNTSLPAILKIPKGYWMTHVLLNEDPDAAADLLLALCADLIPSLWPRASFHAIRDCAAELGPTPLPRLLQSLSVLATGNAQKEQLFRRALARLQRARALHKQGKYPSAVVQAKAAGTYLERLYLTTRAVRKQEIRALWCARPYGAPNQSWNAVAARVQDAGFSTIFVYMADGVSAQYPSRVLASSRHTPAPKDDLLAKALRAGQRQGIQIHPWIQVFHVGDSVRPDRRRELKRRGELAVLRNGDTDDSWLCPSHPQVRARILAAVDELLERYSVPGIHLDYIRHGSSRHCFCPRCRAAFEEQIGRRLDEWPSAVDSHPLARQWKKFRRQTVTSLVADIARRVQSQHPRPVLSAAVFSDVKISRSAVGQDWPLWSRNGWLDALCPMNYERQTEGFRDRLRKQVNAMGASRVALLPGIGVTARDLSLLETVRQIEAAREYGLPGFTLFQYNDRVRRTLLPALGKTITRRP